MELRTHGSGKLFKVNCTENPRWILDNLMGEKNQNVVNLLKETISGTPGPHLFTRSIDTWSLLVVNCLNSCVRIFERPSSLSFPGDLQLTISEDSCPFP